MNKKILALLFLSSIVLSQSLNDLKKMGNQQLEQIKKELQSDAVGAIVQNVTEPQLGQSSAVSITSAAVAVATGDYFGYNYLRKDISFFDNIPTPADYKLGPGDEIIISLWGENNSRETLTINKDGMIFYNSIGFINLSNHTLESAEIMLREELSQIYSTLKDKDNPTKLMLSLGRLKAMNIYFSGMVENPGISLVHPFSDIFSAIVQAGGITSDGSLREIQLIRNSTIINKVDFYSFFMNGKNNFSNIKLIDGDVIHIPTIQRRVTISSGVIRPSSYELLNDETFTDLLKYASGLISTASSDIMINQIIPIEKRTSDDNAISSIATNLEEIESITLNNGDSINILSIPSVSSRVTVFGRVKNPGDYPANNMSLRDVLDIAGGFDDPIYRQSIRENIMVLRLDSNNFYDLELLVSYQDSDDFKLAASDKIFVYENRNYKNSFTYRVEGEVFKPGTYSIKDKSITVREALSLAGGLTELSSERNLTIKQEVTEVDDKGNEVTISEAVNNVSLDFAIGINSVIIASPFENVVRVEGNVYNPGLITYTEGYRFPKYIELAGGYRPNSLKKQTYIKRANGNIEETTRVYLVGKKVYPGDTLIVPVNPDPNDFDITAFISDFSTTLANIAAILLIVDNNTN